MASLLKFKLIFHPSETSLNNQSILELVAWASIDFSRSGQKKFKGSAKSVLFA